ncbi:MAG: coproporphyrinogen-III oxidase family protein [Geminicoccaceae bacterium]
MQPGDDNGLAVYLHWPFVRSIPPYCDFNNFLADAVDESRWIEGLIAGFARQAASLHDKRLLAVFIGGGMPSLLSARAIERLLRAVRAKLATVDDLQVTMEADPEPEMVGRFADYRSAGVTRLSLRVRSLRSAGLTFMEHDRWCAADGLAAIETVTRLFPQRSVDLFYGWPGQTLPDWLREIDQVCGLGLDHVSIYDLEPLPGTVFAERAAAGTLTLLDDDMRAEMFIQATEQMRACGLIPYEIANAGKPGTENRYNLHSWRGGSYIGVGPGAIGRLELGARREATAQIHAPAAWLADIEAGGDGMAERLVLNSRERLDELLVQSLRMAEGITAETAARVLGGRLREHLPPERLQSLLDDGFLIDDADGLRLTRTGWPLHEAIALRLSA